MIPQMEPWFGEEEAQALYQYVLSGGWLTEHTKTREFEQMVADYLDINHCIATCNGTVALFLALKALDIGAGDEVIVPDFTMAATANAVVLAGATPVFVDVDDRLCLNLDCMERAIGDKTKAVIPVDLNGRAPDYSRLFDICSDNGDLSIIEDAAQALGSMSGEDCLGTLGDISIFSFSAPKIISTGNGGILTTYDDELANKLRRLKDFGRERGGIDAYPVMGWNFKFTDLQAVVGIEQMKKLNSRVDRKRQMYLTYRECLEGIPQVRFIETDLAETTPWFIDLLVERRDELMAYLKEEGIGTRPFYPALHSQGAYNQKGHFPKSEYAAGHGLWLPSSCKLTDEGIAIICGAIRDFYAC